MENRAHALAAGLFVLILCAALFGTLWWFSEGPDDMREYVLVTQGSVSGLNVQSQVRYRGMPAGKVSSIRIDPEDPRNILVRIDVREDLPLTRGTRATLGYQGVTGLAFVQLDDKGTDPRPLPAPDGAPPRIGLQPGVVDQITDATLDTLQRLRSVADQLAVFFDERNVARVSGTLERLESAVAGIDRTFADAPAAVASLREALSDENVARLSSVLANLEKASEDAPPAMSELRELVVKLGNLAQQLDQTAEGVGPGLVDRTLPQLNTLLQELTVTSRRMGRLIGEVDASPQLLLLGRGKRQPGPGEDGFEVQADGSPPPPENQ